MTPAASDQAFGWIESVVNRLLEFDPDTRARLAVLSGKVICVEVRDGDVVSARIYLLPNADGVHLSATHDRPDVIIAATAATFARRFLARAGQPVAGELQISGDIELGQRVQRVLQGLDIDGEEMLARVLGDVPAHQLGNLLRASLAWTRSAGKTLARDVAEYLHEEAFVLVKRERVGKFLRAVDELRADTDRLQQRLQRLGEQR